MTIDQMRAKYAELANKWLRKDTTPRGSTAEDFNKLVAGRLRKTVSASSADWKPSDRLAAAEVLVLGNRADQETPPAVAEPAAQPEPEPVAEPSLIPLMNSDVEQLSEMLLVGGRV